MQYEIKKIANDKLSLALAPSYGASVTEFRFIGGEHIMRPAVNFDDPRNMACFSMVPVVNRIENGRFSWRGNDYQMPANMPPEPHYNHGQGWHSKEWFVTEHTDRSITTTLNNNRDEWPFSFTVEQTYRLEEQALVGELRFQNLEDFEVPVGLGFHPYFPKNAATRFTATVEQVALANYETMMPTKLVSEHDLLERLKQGTLGESFMDNSFFRWSGDCIVTQESHSLKMRSRSGFPHLHAYTPEGDFISVEPIGNMTNAINFDYGYDDAKITVLGARQKMEAIFSISCFKG